MNFWEVVQIAKLHDLFFCYKGISKTMNAKRRKSFGLDGRPTQKKPIILVAGEVLNNQVVVSWAGIGHHSVWGRIHTYKPISESEN